MIRDLRKYSQQTSIRLAAGGLLILFLVGDSLIYLFYGKGAALLGLLCLLGGLIPVGAVILILLLLDWISKRASQD